MSGRTQGAQPEWTENRPPRGRLPDLQLAEAWRYRELAFFLAQRTFKLRYKQTFFGVAWALMQPLAALLIFTLVFEGIVGEAPGGVPYVLFAYSGLIAWTYVSGAVDDAARSLADNPDLVTKIYFPRLLAPIAAVLPGLVDLAVTLPFAGVLLIGYERAPDLALVLLPVWVVAAALVALGVGLWLSALNVRYRDVRHVLTFGLQAWFFASPVVYYLDLVESDLSNLFVLNPMVGVLEGFRWSLVAGETPSTIGLLSLGTGTLVLISGLLYFRAAEHRFADVV